jgi:hypothetical protein
MSQRSLGKLINRSRAPDDNSEIFGAGTRSEYQTHVLIIALDYPGTSHSLTCTTDGDNIKNLCTACSITDVTTLYNDQGTFDEVAIGIEEVGSRCALGDCFLLFYAGHGTSVPDLSGDEADGKDEAFCLVTSDGKSDRMTDDQLAQIINDNIPPDVNVIIVSDCCHSGTIADFGSNMWGQTKAVLLSGCTDSQKAEDTGSGGVFTNSMLIAIADLAERGVDNYSCGRLYNETVKHEKIRYDRKQDISCAWSDACNGANTMAWPLIPPAGYKSPAELASWWF